MSERRKQPAGWKCVCKKQGGEPAAAARRLRAAAAHRHRSPTASSPSTLNRSSPARPLLPAIPAPTHIHCVPAAAIMSAVLPRSKSASQPARLDAKSSEGCKKKRTQMGGSTNLQHQFSGKSRAELTRGDHVSACLRCVPALARLPAPARLLPTTLPCVPQPWSGAVEALLRPLPADWRHNIQSAFSSMGAALGKLMSGVSEGVQRKSGGRRF